MQTPIRPFGSGLVRAGLDLLFPPNCVSCGKLGQYLCKNCRHQLVRFTFTLCPVCNRPTRFGMTHAFCVTPDSPDGLVLLYHYGPPISTYIKSIKYAGRYDAVREVPDLVSPIWPKYAPKPDLLIPIPLHPSKRSARGFNQTEMIGHQLSELLEIPLESQILTKLIETTPQAEKKRKQRKKLQQCFTVLQPSRIKNKIVYLVDDVATTGTTLKLAAQATKRAGAKAAWCLALAHA